MRALQDCYELHPLAVEDAINADQLPKVEVYGDQLFVIARTARLQGENIDYGETAIFVGKHHIITVRHGSERAHTALREQLEKAPTLLMHGTDYLLHSMLDYIVDGYVPLVDEIEEEVFADGSAGGRKLPRPRRRQSHLRAAPRAEPAPAHPRPNGGGSSKARAPTAAGDRRRCPDLFSGCPGPCPPRRLARRWLARRPHVGIRVQYLLEQQRVGTITRQLAAWAAILAVPTAFAGIYGMNFQNMPELHTRYGYYYRHRRDRVHLLLALRPLPPAPAGSSRPLQGLISPAPAGAQPARKAAR